MYDFLKSQEPVSTMVFFLPVSGLESKFVSKLPPRALYPLGTVADPAEFQISNRSSQPFPCLVAIPYPPKAGESLLLPASLTQL